MNQTDPTFALCCVVDQHPRFYVEFILWAICVTNNLPGNFHPIVYTAGVIPHDLLDWASTQGIHIIPTNQIVEGSPHSNKIAPFLDDHDADFTIVSDTDLFFLKDPTGLFTDNRFRAAPNNACNPPPRIFHSILAASGLDRPYRPGVALFKGSDGLRETHINNISAGIVAAPRKKARQLGEKWRKWAIWLIENRALLERWAVHVDQVAFALALEELREDVELLPPQVNTILELLSELSTCYAIHLTTGHIPAFPQFFNSDRTIVTEGLDSGLKDGLAHLNGRILEAVQVISSLHSTRDHMEKFLNPNWLR